MNAASLPRRALSIFRAALAASDAGDSVTRYLRGRDLSRYRRIWVVGAGKASAAMAQAAERALGRRIAGGLVNVKYGYTARLRRIELHECGHPIPDAAGVAGARRVAAMAEQAGAGDLLLCLISGGASALLPLPAPGITLADKRAVTGLLLGCGAEIHEINAVRKHLSAIKGGQLARLAAPAAVLTLIVSDVIGDELDTIGSGPTAPDPSTAADALAVLEKYGLLRRVGARVLRGMQRETPKPGDAVFRKVRNVILGSNRQALDAAAARARELGFRTLVLASEVRGETREVARMHAAIARELALRGRPVKPPACILTGGETTVTLRGKGLGGRNQEFALAAAIDIAGLPGTLIFSAGTDGTDGPTGAAGAFADGETLRRGPEARRFLDNNDAYHYFEAVGGLVQTGPTRTNVMDVRMVLVLPRKA